MTERAPKKGAPQRQRGLDDARDAAWAWDRAARLVVFTAGLSAVALVLAIFVFVASEGLGFALINLDIDPSFSSSSWLTAPDVSNEPSGEMGALSMMAGTASVIGLALLIAVPFSLGAAIYIGEFASGRTREILKVFVELLATIPSIVWGFVGLMVVTPILIDTFHLPLGFNVVSAGIVLGLMAAPIMTTIAEDALKAVPDSYREAAEAMGATQWQVIWQVVLPSAKNGLVAAILLGVGRGFAEAMAVLLAYRHAAHLTTSPFDSVRALTSTIAAELGGTVHGSGGYQALFTLALLLFLVTFIVNLLADVLVRRGSAR